jgi:mono/diheme cytochrome c family protein
MPLFPSSLRSNSPWIKAGLMAILLLALAGCYDMRDQPRYNPLDPSEFFLDGRSARSLVPGTVPRGQMAEEDYFFTGQDAEGQYVDDFPFELTREVLDRGQERYDIFCSPCHGLDGYGQGMIVQRGFSPPPSFHSERLRQAPAGYYFDVITNGFGRMYPYAYQVPVDDRWAIIAYVRALQLSQFATEQDVPPEELPGLEETEP